MANKKEVQKLKEKHLLESLKKVEHPHLTGLAIAAVIYTLLLGLSALAWGVSTISFRSAIFTSSFIGLALSGVWVTLRFGLFLGWRLRFVNFRNKKIAKGMETKINVSFTKQEYIELSKKKSWYGMLALFIACAITIVICAILIYA